MRTKKEKTPARPWKEFRGRRPSRGSHAAYAQRRLELELAAMIRKLRLNRGISQAELARRIGTQQSAIARLEGGDDNITLSRLQRVAALLGAEVSIRLKPQAA
ncbi:MAG: helix-turn-helix domain-containing protein [Terriglobia bacterium]